MSPRSSGELVLAIALATVIATALPASVTWSANVKGTRARSLLADGRIAAWTTRHRASRTRSRTGTRPVLADGTSRTASADRWRRAPADGGTRAVRRALAASGGCRDVLLDQSWPVPVSSLRSTRTLRARHWARRHGRSAGVAAGCDRRRIQGIIGRIARLRSPDAGLAGPRRIAELGDGREPAAGSATSRATGRRRGRSPGQPDGARSPSDRGGALEAGRRRAEVLARPAVGRWVRAADRGRGPGPDPRSSSWSCTATT